MIYILYLWFQLRTHAYLYEAEEEEEEEEASMNLPTAIGALVAVTVVTSFVADYRECFPHPPSDEEEGS